MADITYTPVYPAWHDIPATDTPITAAALGRMDEGITAATAQANAALDASAGGGGDQPWQFRPESYGAKRDGRMLTDVSMTSGSAVLTSPGAPFTAGDVGKHIVVPSAGGFTNVPLCTTIASYQSASQVTLATAAASTVTTYGAVYGSDDTAAVQDALNAAVAYAQQDQRAIGEVLLGDGMYCLAGAPGGTYQNAQIQIPHNDPATGHKISLSLTGPMEANGPAHWAQPDPPVAGATLVSMLYNDSAAGQGPPPACVIGGPVEDAANSVFFGGPGGLFSNMRVIVDGISVLVPYRSSFSGLDLFGVGQAHIKSFSYFCMARTGSSSGGWPPYLSGNNNPSAWQTFGYRTPAAGNNDENEVIDLTVYGPYHGVVFTDHFTAFAVKAVFCYFAATASPSGGAGVAHHAAITSLSSEECSAPVFCDSGGGPYGAGGSSQALSIASLHVEDANYIINDLGDQLYGEVHAEMLALTGPIAQGKNGAANIRLIWDYQPLGPVASPPAVPAASSAYQNVFWRDAIVIVTGGTGVSVSLDGQATGQASGAFPVRSGGTINLGTYSAAPTWQWVLT